MSCLFTAPHWCIIDTEQILMLFASVRYPHWGCKEMVHVTKGSHKGYTLPLTLVPGNCDSRLDSAYSSPVLSTSTNPQPFTINDIMVMLFNHLGLGYTAVKEFCGILGMSKHSNRKKRKSLKRPWKLPTQFYRRVPTLSVLVVTIVFTLNSLCLFMLKLSWIFHI